MPVFCAFYSRLKILNHEKVICDSIIDGDRGNGIGTNERRWTLLQGRRRYYHPHTRIIVGLGAGYYSPYYYPFYYPPYDYGYRRPSRLELKIEDIRADYQDKIYSVRHDKSISKSERKATIHQLKSDRELAIHDAQRNYYKPYDNSPGSSNER